MELPKVSILNEAPDWFRLAECKLVKKTTEG
jgi:hypothetical protein